MFDPEIPVNIYDLGLIYDVIVESSNRVGIRMTLTAPACPAAQFLPGQVKNAVESVPDVTGAIVDVAKVDPMPKAAGKWNTYEITAQGSHLVVVLNGQKTADVQDSKHNAGGPFALQYGSGVVKFRKVQIKPL